MAYVRIATVPYLMRKLREAGRATAANAEAVARKFIADSGCRTVVVTGESGSAVEWVVSDNIIPEQKPLPEALRRKRRERRR